MRNSELLRQAIDDGQEGKNVGLSMGSKKLNQLVGGLQYGRYDLIGGNTGSSKTAFTDFFYVVKPWMILNDLRKRGESERSMKVFYWSLEIRKVRKLAKWLALKIFLDYRILIDIKTILGMFTEEGNSQKNRIPDELYQILMKELALFDEMEDDIHIIEDKVSPNGIYAHLKSYSEAHGQVESVPVMDRGRFLYNKDRYIPNNPKELVLSIVDHVGLMKANKDEGNKKGTIDIMSSYFVTLRNFHNYSFVAVSQFNRDLADVNRQRFKELTPQLEDFKDSGNSQEDCEVAIALFNPVTYNMESYNNYNIRRMLDKFKSVNVLKNRDGIGNTKVGYNFIGACGAYSELPIGTEMTEDDYNFVNRNWPNNVS